MKARTRDRRRRPRETVSAGFHPHEVASIDPADACAVPRPRIERRLSSLPAIRRAAEVLRFSFARAEHWLSPGGRLREAVRRALVLWCLLVIAGLLIAPMVTVLLGQVAAWTSLLAFAVKQLMLVPLGLAVFLLGVKGVHLLWRRLFGR